jgi:hypothetical protein
MLNHSYVLRVQHRIAYINITVVHSHFFGHSLSGWLVGWRGCGWLDHGGACMFYKKKENQFFYTYGVQSAGFIAFHLSGVVLFACNFHFLISRVYYSMLWPYITRIISGFIIAILCIISAVAISGRAFAVGLGLLAPSALFTFIFAGVRIYEERSIARCKVEYATWKSGKAGLPPPTIDYKLECYTLRYVASYNDLLRRKNELRIPDEYLTGIHGVVRCYKCSQVAPADFYIADDCNFYHTDCVARLF